MVGISTGVRSHMACLDSILLRSYWLRGIGEERFREDIMREALFAETGIVLTKYSQLKSKIHHLHHKINSKYRPSIVHFLFFKSGTFVNKSYSAVVVQHQICLPD